MNLDDLRAQLHHQATEIDPATPVPLPTIHRRAKTVKRRRTAAIITSAAAAVAVALAVLPGAINNSAPDPVKPPPDYTRDGITIPGTVGQDRLEQAWISEKAVDSARFAWTPKATSVTLRSYCSSTAASPRDYLVWVNERLVVNKPCDDAGNSPRDPVALPPDHVLWLDATPGRAASVQIQVVDRVTRDHIGGSARIALGIYDSPQASDPAGGPVRLPSPDADDFVKAGVVYRAKVGDETRLAAAVGDPAQANLNLRFTSTGAPLTLRLFCAANKTFVKEKAYILKVRLDGRPLDVPQGHDLCLSKTTEAALQGNLPISRRIRKGRAVNITVAAVKLDGSLADASRLILGVGVYSRL